MSNEVRLRNVEPNDLPIFYEQQLDADATRMAAFPARDRAAFDAHWATNILGNPAATKKKGRLREGGDADIVVFDPERIIDRATFREPTRPSQGVRHVLINGALVVRDGIIQESILVGRPVRAPVF